MKPFKMWANTNEEARSILNYMFCEGCKFYSTGTQTEDWDMHYGGYYADSEGIITYSKRNNREFYEGHKYEEFNFATPVELAEECVQTSDTNPKKQFGDKSLPLNLWPALASSYGALGLYNGKLKYGQCNFNATPVEASIYIAGAMRHLSAWAEGEEFDPADGVPNLGGVLANVAILLEARAAGTLIDDRKLGSGYLKERESLKKIVSSLQELHKDKSPRHFTLVDKQETKNA